MRKGFTLIELLVVMAVVLILMGFASVNLFNLPTSANISSTADVIVSDLRTQQIKAMVGDTEGRGIPDSYGIYFTPGSYIEFHGSTYSPTDPTNFNSTLPSGYNLQTTFPNSVVIFTKESGEILNYSAGMNTITLINTKSGQQKIITLNEHGIITNIQ